MVHGDLEDLTDVGASIFNDFFHYHVEAFGARVLREGCLQ